ncbi:MAG: hypothetical protein AB7G15_14805, partial [Alphaproteobacteria bacterium]
PGNNQPRNFVNPQNNQNNLNRPQFAQPNFQPRNVNPQFTPRANQAQLRQHPYQSQPNQTNFSARTVPQGVTLRVLPAVNPGINRNFANNNWRNNHVVLARNNVNFNIQTNNTFARRNALFQHRIHLDAARFRQPFVRINFNNQPHYVGPYAYYHRGWANPAYLRSIRSLIAINFSFIQWTPYGWYSPYTYRSFYNNAWHDYRYRRYVAVYYVQPVVPLYDDYYYVDETPDFVVDQVYDTEPYVPPPADPYEPDDLDDDPELEPDARIPAPQQLAPSQPTQAAPNVQYLPQPVAFYYVPYYNFDPLLSFAFSVKLSQ